MQGERGIIGLCNMDILLHIQESLRACKLFAWHESCRETTSAALQPQLHLCCLSACPSPTAATPSSCFPSTRAGGAQGTGDRCLSLGRSRAPPCARSPKRLELLCWRCFVIGCFPSQLERCDCSLRALLSPVPARWPSRGSDMDPSVRERWGWDPTAVRAGPWGAGSSLGGIAAVAEGDGLGWQSQPKAQRLSGINTPSLHSHRGCRGLAVPFPPVQLEKNNSGRWEGSG